MNQLSNVKKSDFLCRECYMIDDVQFLKPLHIHTTVDGELFDEDWTITVDEFPWIVGTGGNADKCLSKILNQIQSLQNTLNRLYEIPAELVQLRDYVNGFIRYYP